MKTFLSALILLISSVAVVAQDEKSFFVGGGATYNMVKNLTISNPVDQLGFYVVASQNGKLTDHFGYTGEGVITNQRIKYAGVTTSVYSANGGFYFNYYPTKEKLRVLAGVQFGMILDAKSAEHEIDGYGKGYFSFNYGLAYQLDKIEIIAKSNNMIGLSAFDGYFSIGAGYKIN